MEGAQPRCTTGQYLHNPTKVYNRSVPTQPNQGVPQVSTYTIQPRCTTGQYLHNPTKVYHRCVEQIHSPPKTKATNAGKTGFCCFPLAQCVSGARPHSTKCLNTSLESAELLLEFSIDSTRQSSLSHKHLLWSLTAEPVCFVLNRCVLCCSFSLLNQCVLC